MPFLGVLVRLGVQRFQFPVGLSLFAQFGLGRSQGFLGLAFIVPPLFQA
jgi:hypothetical protein